VSVRKVVRDVTICNSNVVLVGGSGTRLPSTGVAILLLGSSSIWGLKIDCDPCGRRAVISSSVAPSSKGSRFHFG
jgi:hypothetical protein